MKNIGIGLLVVIVLYVGYSVIRSARVSTGKEKDSSTQQIDKATEQLRKQTEEARKKSLQSP